MNPQPEDYPVPVKDMPEAESVLCLSQINAEQACYGYSKKPFQNISGKSERKTYIGEKASFVLR